MPTSARSVSVSSGMFLAPEMKYGREGIREASGHRSPATLDAKSCATGRPSVGQELGEVHRPTDHTVQSNNYRLRRVAPPT